MKCETPTSHCPGKVRTVYCSWSFLWDYINDLILNITFGWNIQIWALKYESFEFGCLSVYLSVCVSVSLCVCLSPKTWKLSENKCKIFCGRSWWARYFYTSRVLSLHNIFWLSLLDIEISLTFTFKHRNLFDFDLELELELRYFITSCRRRGSL